MEREVPSHRTSQARMHHSHSYDFDSNSDTATYSASSFKMAFPGHFSPLSFRHPLWNEFHAEDLMWIPSESGHTPLLYGIFGELFSLQWKPSWPNGSEWRCPNWSFTVGWPLWLKKHLFVWYAERFGLPLPGPPWHCGDWLPPISDSK